MAVAFAGIYLISGEPRIQGQELGVAMVLGGAFMWACGQVLIQGMDDLFYFNVMEQVRSFGLSAEAANLALEAVPIVSGRKVRAAAELLRLVAEKLSEQTVFTLEEARVRQHQQAEIAEAILSHQERGDEFEGDTGKGG